MKRKLSPPPDKQNTPGILYRNTNTTGKKKKKNLFMAFKQVPRVIKASTRMILVHVQKMYNIFRILIGVPDYSSSRFFFVFFKK